MPRSPTVQEAPMANPDFSPLSGSAAVSELV
jgi:hypothetical protein